ncbi:hypothetical protein ACNOYE_29120 [Nannocystaceae bacterium ST9]
MDKKPPKKPTPTKTKDSLRKDVLRVVTHVRAGRIDDSDAGDV